MFLKIVDIFFGFWGTFSISAEKLKKKIILVLFLPFKQLSKNI